MSLSKAASVGGLTLLQRSADIREVAGKLGADALNSGDDRIELASPISLHAAALGLAKVDFSSDDPADCRDTKAHCLAWW